MRDSAPPTGAASAGAPASPAAPADAPGDGSPATDSARRRRGAPGAPLTEWTPQRVRRNLRQFVKFGLVGTSGVFVNLVVFNLTMRTWELFHGQNPLEAKYLANLLGFAVSVLSNYYLNRRWTFRSGGSVRRELPKFFTVSVTAYLANLAVFTVCLTQLDIAPNPSQLIAIACVMPINFVANKLWSFRR